MASAVVAVVASVASGAASGFVAAGLTGALIGGGIGLAAGLLQARGIRAQEKAQKAQERSALAARQAARKENERKAFEFLQARRRQIAKRRRLAEQAKQQTENVGARQSSSGISAIQGTTNPIASILRTGDVSFGLEKERLNFINQSAIFATKANSLEASAQKFFNLGTTLGQTAGAFGSLGNAFQGSTPNNLAGTSLAQNRATAAFDPNLLPATQ